jgi:hypothetical protein
MDHKPRLLDQHYSLRTDRDYVDWIKRIIRFHEKRHPASIGAPEVHAFLSHLAVEQKVATSTQRQALGAIMFLYRDMLDREVGWLGETHVRSTLNACKQGMTLSAIATRE